jgi:CDP-diacylglycerol--glycerol-3-phosphate 3-phosphatidyltransferase
MTLITSFIEWLQSAVKFIPAWVPANLITLLRALLLIPIYFVYQSGHPLWVFILFLLAWFTDILDGLHARYRHQISSLGKLLDPAMDKVFVLGLLWMLAPGRLSWSIILVTVALELLIVLLTVLAAPIAARFLKRRLILGANLWGKIKMFLQGSGLVALILGLDIPALRYFSEVLFWLAALFAGISLVFYTRSIPKSA